MAIQIGSSAIAAVMLGNSVVDAIYLGAAGIGAGGGGGGATNVTFNGQQVTYNGDVPVTYTPDLWLFMGQRVTYQGDGIILDGA